MAAPKKNRVPIPPDVDAAVQFAADRTCCLCHVTGKHIQIHHVDEDPSNNDLENLAVLCLECHAQTQVSGGFGKRLSARVVRRYREHWLSVVSMRRSAELLEDEVRADVQGETSSRSAAIKTPAVIEGSVHRNNAVEITLIDVRESPYVEVNRSNYRQGSGYEAYSNIRTPGGKYVTVRTRVLNDGTSSIDLTCGYPIGTHIVDTKGRRFDAIDKLYEIRGNPECNYGLQPGFQVDMTWVYLTPESAVVAAWEFKDVENHDWNSGPMAPTAVPLK